jgi:hypothetical protein
LDEKIFTVTFKMQKCLAAFVALASVVFLFLTSCVSHDFPENVCVETYSFSDDVKPIIETKCAISGCHNGDMGQNLNWTDFSEFHQRAQSGLVKSRVINRTMPPANSAGGPLSQEEINAIACWTDQGVLNN